ncbi:MAG TPA: hypothetical protein VJN96_11980 [Vicinamibacterales bacterium]|nr:hypothetical protein [Vicinamibacterales bacterium]
MTRWLRPSAIVLLCTFAGLVERPSAAVQAPADKPAPCTAPEYRQFDFWIGDWDVFDAGNSAPVARVVVDRILDGCALREDYQGANGTRGQSFSTYDSSRRVWHQTWVTNRGQLLVIEGALRGRGMVLAGTDPASGPLGRVRGVWTPQGDGVREVAVTSTDGGKTWRPWFDLVFKRRR